jgi:hypothetical protein
MLLWLPVHVTTASASEGVGCVALIQSIWLVAFGTRSNVSLLHACWRGAMWATGCWSCGACGVIEGRGLGGVRERWLRQFDPSVFLLVTANSWVLVMLIFQHCRVLGLCHWHAWFARLALEWSTRCILLCLHWQKCGLTRGCISGRCMHGIVFGL